ncbi:MAG: hypothetical protein WAS23_11975 [Dokdonella sp.]|uniref:hypothetical protein n=1 Tax=Dokdonella sp. TaxID=2291710 RepID=UPI002C56FDD5|nr:hypothetical protein [Dokdonella sp.]HOX71964.1 hypothetical protein [Dokdonella sp.]
MRNSVIGALALCLAIAIPRHSEAANFQVVVKRLSVTQCSLTGSLLNIDPATGNVTIDLDSDVNCYPAAVNQLAASGTLTVTSSQTTGGGTNGVGSVTVLLNTGLSGVTSGVTCAPDGVVASSVSVTGDWSSTLCTNCGATVSRTIGVQHSGGTSNGSIAFKAKCTYQDPQNANLQTVRNNIVSAPVVTVIPGSTPPPTFCTSVSQLGAPNGLTPAMRQATGPVTGGTLPGTSVDFLNYVSVFGVSSGTFPAGSGDTAGYGFPGTNKSTLSSKLDRGKYISMQFRVPSDAAWNGRLGFFHMTPGSSTYLQLAIAPCPGQFAADSLYPLPGAGCSVGAKSSDIPWMITTGSTASCKLEPGKTYYLNFINAFPGSLDTPLCAGAQCSFQMRNSHNY